MTEIPQASRYMSQPLIIGCSVTLVNLHLLRHHSCWEVLRPQCLTSSLMTSLPSPLDGSSTRAAVTAFRYRDEEFWFGGRQERLLVVSWYAYSYLFIGSILNLKWLGSKWHHHRCMWPAVGTPIPALQRLILLLPSAITLCLLLDDRQDELTLVYQRSTDVHPNSCVTYFSWISLYSCWLLIRLDPQN